MLVAHRPYWNQGYRLYDLNCYIFFQDSSQRKGQVDSGCYQSMAMDFSAWIASYIKLLLWFASKRDLIVTLWSLPLLYFDISYLVWNCISTVIFYPTHFHPCPTIPRVPRVFSLGCAPGPLCPFVCSVSNLVLLFNSLLIPMFFISGPCSFVFWTFCVFCPPAHSRDSRARLFTLKHSSLQLPAFDRLWIVERKRLPFNTKTFLEDRTHLWAEHLPYM